MYITNEFILFIGVTNPMGFYVEKNNKWCKYDNRDFIDRQHLLVNEEQHL